MRAETEKAPPMNTIKFIFLLIITCLLSCKEKPTDLTTNYSLLEISEDNATPTVDISNYSLINDPQNDHRDDAKEILKVKRQWPLAMQSLSPLAFDSILSKDFTFKSGDTFFNRADYIKNRTTPDDWKITFVEYDNVTLQFFGNTAILSYNNHVRNEKTVTKEVEIEHISWVDIYIKENDKWMLGGAHSIDYRLEVAPDTLQSDK
jgi:hypothetical protein